MAFWNKNKHDICPSEKELKTLVTNYLGGNSQIKINSKLSVPDGYFCVLGRKGKVADKFDTGEYFLNFASMPYMCRRFGIDKVKDGKQKEKFPCNVYFVSKELQAGQFKTYRKVEMGTRAYGIYKAHVFGMYSYRVVNSQELLQSLLNEYDYIKTGEAGSLIAAWVNDLVVSTLEKKNFVISDVVANNPIIAESLRQAINKLFETAGLELCELKIYKYKLPKQYQAESDKIMAKEKISEYDNVVQDENLNNEIQNESCETIDDIKEENCIKPIEKQAEINKNDDIQNFNFPTTSQSQKEETITQIIENTQNVQKNNIDENANSKYNQYVNETDYVPFGNFVINKGSIECLNQKTNIETKKEQKPKFVDLNLENLYADKKQDTKRCLNCGAENNKTADHCILCGEKFVEGDF